MRNYNLRNSTQFEKLVGTFDPADKKQLGNTITEMIKWLDVCRSEQGVRGEAEGSSQPIMQRQYGTAGGSPGGIAGAGGPWWV